MNTTSKNRMGKVLTKLKEAKLTFELELLCGDAIRQAFIQYYDKLAQKRKEKRIRKNRDCLNLYEGMKEAVEAGYRSNPGEYLFGDLCSASCIECDYEERCPVPYKLDKEFCDYGRKGCPYEFDCDGDCD